MSTNSTAQPGELPCASSSSSVRVNSRRLTSPVSGSCRAMCVSSASALLRSVMSAKTPSKQASGPSASTTQRAWSRTHTMLPVGVQEAVLVVEHARRLRVVLLAHDALAVVGVDALQPQLGVAPSTARREPEHGLDLRAHVEAAPGRARLPAVGAHRHAFEQRTEALFTQIVGGVLVHAAPAQPAARLLSYRHDTAARLGRVSGVAGNPHDGGVSAPAYPARMRRLRLTVCARALLAWGAAPASGGTLDGLTDAQIAARFAPRLVLHPDERYAPTSADELLALGATLVDRTGAVVQPAPLTPAALPVGNSCVGGLPCAYALRLGCGLVAARPCPAPAGTPPLIYARVVRRHPATGSPPAWLANPNLAMPFPNLEVVVQYWLYSLVDDWRSTPRSVTLPGGRKLSLPAVHQHHEGDWEAITVGMSADRPLFVDWSAHCAGEWRPFAERRWSPIPAARGRTPSRGWRSARTPTCRPP